MHFLSVVLFALVMALQAADAFLTWRVLRAGGRELNPVVRFLIDRFGTIRGLVLAKLVLVAAAGLFLRDHLLILLAISALYVWVVYHNWQQLLRRGRQAVERLMP
jgi:hypothetical protein